MIAVKPAQPLKVTISRDITRAAARKTIERLFLSDKAKRKEVAVRASHFVTKPKRRGGRIWTKYPNKVALKYGKGDSATVKATAQHMRDLASVEEFVEIKIA